ncbi:hypothetical protein JCM39068_41360 [Desulfocastanea catecholica]
MVSLPGESYGPGKGGEGGAYAQVNVPQTIATHEFATFTTFTGFRPHHRPESGPSSAIYVPNGPYSQAILQTSIT